MKKIILSIILCTFYYIGTSQDSGVERNAEVKVNSTNTFAEMKIYPNPCKQEKVTIESNYNNISEINVANIAGKQVYQKKFLLPEIKAQIELSEIPNGIYLVKIKTNENNQVVKKLIVSKE